MARRLLSCWVRMEGGKTNVSRVHAGADPERPDGAVRGQPRILRGATDVRRGAGRPTQLSTGRAPLAGLIADAIAPDARASTRHLGPDAGGGAGSFHDARRSVSRQPDGSGRAFRHRGPGPALDRGRRRRRGLVAPDARLAL